MSPVLMKAVGQACKRESEKHISNQEYKPVQWFFVTSQGLIRRLRHLLRAPYEQ